MSAGRSQRIRLHERLRHWELELLSENDEEDEFTRGLENLREGLANTVSAIFTASGLQLDALAKARTRLPKPDAWSVIGARDRFLTPRYHELAFGIPVEVSKVSAGGDVCSQPPAMRMTGLTTSNMSEDTSLMFVFLPMANFFSMPQTVNNATDLTSRVFIPASREVEEALEAAEAAEAAKAGRTPGALGTPWGTGATEAARRGSTESITRIKDLIIEAEEMEKAKEEEREIERTMREEMLQEKDKSLDDLQEKLSELQQNLQYQKEQTEDRQTMLDEVERKQIFKEEELQALENKLGEEQDHLQEKKTHLEEKEISLDTREESLNQREQTLAEQQLFVYEKNCQQDIRQKEQDEVARQQADQAQKLADEEQRQEHREEELNSKEQDLNFKEETLLQETQAVKERELKAEEEERRLEGVEQRVKEEEERLREYEETLAEKQAKLAAEDQRLSEYKASLEEMEEALKEREAKVEEFSAQLQEKEKEFAQKDEEQALKDEEQALKDEEHAKKDEEQAMKDEEHAKKDEEQAKRDEEQATKEEELAAIEQHHEEVEEKLKEMLALAEVREATLNGRQELIEEDELKHQAWEIKAKEEEERLKDRERLIEENEEMHREWEIKSREEREMIEERQKALQELEEMLKDWEKRTQEEEEKLKEEEAKIKEAEENLREKEQKVEEEEMKQKERRRVLEEEEERQREVIQRLEEEEEKQREVERKLEEEEEKYRERDQQIQDEERKQRKKEEAMWETCSANSRFKVRQVEEPTLSVTRGVGNDTVIELPRPHSPRGRRTSSPSPGRVEPGTPTSVLVEDDVLMVSSYKDKETKSTILETYDIKYLRETIFDNARESVSTHGRINTSKGVRVSRDSESFMLSAEETGRGSASSRSSSGSRSRSKSPTNLRNASPTMSERSHRSEETGTTDLSVSPAKGKENDTDDDSPVQGQESARRSVSFCGDDTVISITPIPSTEGRRRSSDRSHSKSPPPFLERYSCTSPTITLSPESKKTSPVLSRDMSLHEATAWSIKETGGDKELTSSPGAIRHSFPSAQTPPKTTLGSERGDTTDTAASDENKESHDVAGTITSSPKLSAEKSPVTSLKLRVLETVEEFGEDQETEDVSSSQLTDGTTPKESEGITSGGTDIVRESKAPQKSVKIENKDGYSLESSETVCSSYDSAESVASISIDCISPKLAQIYSKPASPVLADAGESEDSQPAVGHADVVSPISLSEEVSTARPLTDVRAENILKMDAHQKKDTSLLESVQLSDLQPTPPTLDEWSIISTDESSTNDTDTTHEPFTADTASAEDTRQSLLSLDTPLSALQDRREHMSEGSPKKQASPPPQQRSPDSSPKQFVSTSPPKQFVSTSSPPEQFVSTSPPKQFASTSPPKQFVSTSPPKQFASTSPPKQFVSTSPPKQFASTSPPKQFVSTSPPKQFASTSPPKQFVSTSPPKQFVSTSPPKQFVSTSPPKQFSSTSPPKQFVSTSPPKQFISTLPPSSMQSSASPRQSSPSKRTSPEAISKVPQRSPLASPKQPLTPVPSPRVMHFSPSSMKTSPTALNRTTPPSQPIKKLGSPKSSPRSVHSRLGSPKDTAQTMSPASTAPSSVVSEKSRSSSPIKSSPTRSPGAEDLSGRESLSPSRSSKHGQSQMHKSASPSMSLRHSPLRALSTSSRRQTPSYQSPSSSKSSSVRSISRTPTVFPPVPAKCSSLKFSKESSPTTSLSPTRALSPFLATVAQILAKAQPSGLGTLESISPQTSPLRHSSSRDGSPSVNYGMSFPSPKRSKSPSPSAWSQSHKQPRPESLSPTRIQTQTTVQRARSKSPTHRPKQGSSTPPTRKRSVSATLSPKPRSTQKHTSLSASPSKRQSSTPVEKKIRALSLPRASGASTPVSVHSLSPGRRTSTSSQSTSMSISPTGRPSTSSEKIKHASSKSTSRSPKRRRHLFALSPEEKSSRHVSPDKCSPPSKSPLHSPVELKSPHPSPKRLRSVSESPPKVLSSPHSSPRITISKSPSPLVTKSPYPSPVITKSPYPSPVVFESPPSSLKAVWCSDLRPLVVIGEQMSLSSTGTSDERITLSTVPSVLLSKPETTPESMSLSPSRSKRSTPQPVESGELSLEPTKRLRLSSRTVSNPIGSSELFPHDSKQTDASRTATPLLLTAQVPPSNSASSVSVVSQTSATRSIRRSPAPGRRSVASWRLSPVQDRCMSDMLETQRRKVSSPRPSAPATASRRTPLQNTAGDRTLSDVLASLPGASSPSPAPMSPIPSPLLVQKPDMGAATASHTARSRPSSSAEARGRNSRAASVSPKPSHAGAALQVKGTADLKSMLARQRKASQSKTGKTQPTKVTPPTTHVQHMKDSETGSTAGESTTSSYPLEQVSTSVFQKRVDRDFGPPSSIVTITQRKVRYSKQPINMKDLQVLGSKHPSPPMISSSVPLPIADTVHQPTPILPSSGGRAAYDVRAGQRRMTSVPLINPTSPGRSEGSSYSSGSRHQTTGYSTSGRSRENTQQKRNVHGHTKSRSEATPPSPRPKPRLGLLQMIDAEQQREEHEANYEPSRRNRSASTRSPRSASEGSSERTGKVASPRTTSRSPSNSSGYKYDSRTQIMDPHHAYPPRLLSQHEVPTGIQDKHFLTSGTSNYGTDQMRERERIIRDRLRTKKHIKDIERGRLEVRSGDSDYSTDFSDFFKEYQTECKVKGIVPMKERLSAPSLPTRRLHQHNMRTSSPKSANKPPLPKRREDLTFTSPPFKRRALGGYEESSSRQQRMHQTWSSETNSTSENTCNSSPIRRMRGLELSRFQAYPRKSPRSSPGNSMVVRDSNDMPMALSQQLQTYRHQQGMVGDSVETLQIGRPNRMSPAQSSPTVQLAREENIMHRSPRKHGRRVSWNDNQSRDAEAMVTDDSCNQNAMSWLDEDVTEDGTATFPPPTRGSFPVVHDRTYRWKSSAENESRQSHGRSASEPIRDNFLDRLQYSQGDGFQQNAENRKSPHHPSVAAEGPPRPPPRISRQGAGKPTTGSISRTMSDTSSITRDLSSSTEGEKEKSTSSSIQFSREQWQTTEYKPNETAAFAREEQVQRKEFTAKSDLSTTSVGQKHSLRKRYTMQNQQRRASVTEERQHTREYIFKKNPQTARFPEHETSQHLQALPTVPGGDSRQSPTYQRTQPQQKPDTCKGSLAASETPTPTRTTDSHVGFPYILNAQVQDASGEITNNLSLSDELRNAGFLPLPQRRNTADDQQAVPREGSVDVVDYGAVDQWLEESVDPFYHYSRSHIYDLNESANSSALADSGGETLSPGDDNACDGWDCAFFTPEVDQGDTAGAVGGDTGVSVQHLAVVEHDNLGFHSPQCSDSSELGDREEWMAVAGKEWDRACNTYEETRGGESGSDFDENDNALYFSVPFGQSNNVSDKGRDPTSSTLPVTDVPVSRRRRRRYGLRSDNKNNSGDDHLKLSPQPNPRYRGTGQENAPRGGISETSACAGEGIRKGKAADVAEKTNPVRQGRLNRQSPEDSTKPSSRRRRRSFGRSYLSRMMAKREQSQSQDSSDNCAHRHSCRAFEEGRCVQCSLADDATRGYKRCKEDEQSKVCRAQTCSCEREDEERFDLSREHCKHHTPTTDHEDDDPDVCQTDEECDCMANLAAALNLQDDSIIPRAVSHHLWKRSEHAAACDDPDCECLSSEHEREEEEDSNSYENGKEAAEEGLSSPQDSIPSAYSDECQCGGQEYHSPERGGEGDVPRWNDHEGNYNMSKCHQYSQHRVDGNRRRRQFEARQDKGESQQDDDEGNEDEESRKCENTKIPDRRDYYHYHHRDHQQHHHDYQRHQRLLPPPPLPATSDPDNHNQQQQQLKQHHHYQHFPRDNKMNTARSSSIVTSDICPVTTNEVPPPRPSSPRDAANNFTVTESMMLAYGYNPLKESPFTARGYPPLQVEMSSLDHISVPFVKRKALVFLRTDKEEFVEVGRGTYGCVYLAQATTRRGTAKVVVKDFFADSTSWDLIVHEARMLCYLQDTGVIPHFYGLLKRRSLGDDFSLIQQYFAQGKTLHTALVDKEQLPPNVWLDIAWQLACGLLLIHERHVLLNDLKGDNVLIDLRRERKIIKYIDLGMATFRKGLNFHLPEDQMSKFNFLSPEVRAGAYTSPMSDVYSLGYLVDQINRLAQLPVLKDISMRCMDELPADRPALPDVVDILLPDADQLTGGCSD